MCVGEALVGALYHPPRPQYSAASQLDYVALTRDHPTSVVVLADDFNHLSYSAVMQRTGLTQLVSATNARCA